MDLEQAFHQVAARLAQEQAALNQADETNHNHGDHMVEIFEVAAQVAGEHQSAPLAQAMEAAAAELFRRPQNDSAQVYGRGLTLLAEQLRQHEIELEDLLTYTRRQLDPAAGESDDLPGAQKRSGELVKALLAALSDWEQAEAAAQDPSRQKSSGLDLGYLLGLGMAYMQAKGRGGSRAATLAETVVSASPLSQVPHRQRSGQLAVQALLEAFGEPGGDPPG